MRSDPRGDARTVLSSTRSRNLMDFQETASATRSEISEHGCGRAAPPGNVVSTTQIVSVPGSAQARVPVNPLCPNVASEQPGLPEWAPMANPSPRGGNPSGL